MMRMILESIRIPHMDEAAGSGGLSVFTAKSGHAEIGIPCGRLFCIFPILIAIRFLRKREVVHDYSHTGRGPVWLSVSLFFM